MAMYSRSNSLILTIPSNNFYQDSFDYRYMSRSTKPEIFTFEQVPIQAQQRNPWVRNRRKNTRVMYPSQVRKYLPPAEKSRAKRWLLILCLVVFLQIYTEEPYSETSTNAESAALDLRIEDLSFAQYRILPFQSAEQQARQFKSYSNERQQKGHFQHQLNSLALHLNTTCPSWDSEVTVKSRRNSYVVALLYPYYHRLGIEK